MAYLGSEGFIRLMGFMGFTGFDKVYAMRGCARFIGSAVSESTGRSF